MSILDDNWTVDVESEIQLLGGLMSVAGAYDKVSHLGLTAASFHQPEAAAMWRAIESLAVASKPCDQFAVLEALRKQGQTGVPRAYVADAASAASPSLPCPSSTGRLKSAKINGR